MSEIENRKLLIAAFSSFILLIFSIGIFWLVMKILAIKIVEGDAVLIALILIPLFFFLAISGLLKEMSILGVSAGFVAERVDNIKDDLTEISEYEPQRSVYLGKLKQIIEKQNEKIRFCLIDADIDHLRQHSRKIFLNNKSEIESATDRESEKDIRRKIINILAFAIADAFCKTSIKDFKNKDAKYDIFYLEEPDFVMVARDTTLEQARSVATLGQELFKTNTKAEINDNLSVTIAIVSSQEMKDPKPRLLDKRALDRLNNGKTQGRGGVYDL